jgi:hypothetical protein
MRTFRQVLSTAVHEFSLDPRAKFDFMKAAMRNRPLPDNYTAYLLEFFYSANEYYKKKGMSTQQAFDNATERLSERFLDSFLHHSVRNKIAILPSRIPKEKLEEVDGHIRKLLPCSAAKHFDGTGEVHCDSIFESHGEVHQSSEVYMQEVPNMLFEFFAKLFGKTAKKTATQACRWEGTFQTQEMYATIGWFVDSKLMGSDRPMTTVEYFNSHDKVLESQKEILAQIKTTRLCLACLLDIPTEVLECDHFLCVTCCKELRKDGVVECPFCNHKKEWAHVDIPEGAGFRVLAISGAGVRGLVSTLLLQHIEDQLSIPIYQLFDIIVGTSAGGLNALLYGVKKMNGSEVKDKFASAVIEAFKDRPDMHLLQLGYQYFSKARHSALETLIPETVLFGSSQIPRVAVVASEVSGTEPQLVFFTSYNSATPPPPLFQREIHGTLLDAAEAAFSSEAYFAVFSLSPYSLSSLPLFLSLIPITF